ncbi:hypothetical protein FV140_13425 [Paenarthrobacter ureafaciens]|nr:hypothetical protein FV140_13425 [Paenarthrobacter ureafaciens]
MLLPHLEVGGKDQDQGGHHRRAPPRADPGATAAEVGNIGFWVERDEMDPAWVAMTAHHRLVRVHPFVDGNGRITRLFADLLLFSLTLRYTFDWQPALESHRYFEGLREADLSLDVGMLLGTVGLIDLED